MSAAREQMLGAIRRSLGRPAAGGPDERSAGVGERLAAHPRNTIPARGVLPPAALLDLFVRMAEGVSATVARVATRADVPDAVAAFLAGHNLPAVVRAAPDEALADIPWGRRPTLEVTRGRAEDRDATSVTGAVAGIAETGTLMLASGPGRPTSLNFMPENHIVVLDAGQVVGPYEHAWDRLRAAGALPRTVNLITGPSRTGDIEQKIQLGAHGPRRLHIVLVDGAG
jgi:L-lactate dehydrogenase complex protein LldG